MKRLYGIRQGRHYLICPAIVMAVGSWWDGERCITFTTNELSIVRRQWQEKPILIGHGGPMIGFLYDPRFVGDVIGASGAIDIEMCRAVNPGLYSELEHGKALPSSPGFRRTRFMKGLLVDHLALALPPARPVCPLLGINKYEAQTKILKIGGIKQ